MDENNRVALVTGGNRGLGFETVRLLAEGGTTTILASRDPERGERAAAELWAQGLPVEAIALDVDSEPSVRAAADHITRTHGRLDVLVNNAGILPEATAPDADQPLDVDLFRQTFQTNVLGVVTVTRHVLPLLLDAPEGRIVNVSTTMGSLADQADPASPYHGLVVAAYRSSKAAVNSITISLANAFADRPLKVNSVCPGWVQTDLGGPANRAAAPLTAAAAARVVTEMARLPADGPSGCFVDAQGPVPW